MRSLLDARRDRRLGSDAEAGRFARRSARLIHRQVLRRKWRLFALVSLGIAVITVGAVLVQENPFVRGLTVGIAVTATIAMIAFAVVLFGGTAPLMMGEMAEQWTAQSLRPLERHGWHLANHFLLNNGDADHILVGPGGVVVLETKWRREPWRAQAPDIDRDAAIAQAKQAAESVRLRLGGDLRVEAAVVLWTSVASGSSDPGTERLYDDVVIVPGPRLEAWAHRRGRHRFDDQEVAQLWARLKDQKLNNTEYERRTSPIPMSFDNMVLVACSLVVLAVLGMLASGWLFTATQSFPLWFGGTAAVGLGYAAARRSALLRYPALAFALGWAASLVFVAGVLVKLLLF